jgi:RNA polymerase sigma-70 factor, ECF subfamily
MENVKIILDPTGCCLSAESLAALWDHMHARLYRFICARLVDKNDAEDILQDVFMRIHANIGRVRNMERLESWIFQIARNSIVDQYRRRRAVAGLDDLLVEEEFEVEDTAITLAGCLREAVDSLPEPYREALILTEYAGLSQKELAQRLGISFSGAKSRVQRARQKVKDILLSGCHLELEAHGIMLDFRKQCCCCETLPNSN